jgi:hypothetical protein
MFNTLINQPHTVFNTVSAAETIASRCNDDGDGWEYRVVPDPLGSGRAIIKVFDEDGFQLGNL